MAPALYSDGILAVVVVVIYVPMLIVAIRIMVSSKDPLRRWQTLLACILYRLVGSAMLIPAGSPLRPSLPKGYLAMCFTLDVSCSWALAVCAAYLINIADECTVAQRGSSSVSGDQRKTRIGALLSNVTLVIVFLPSVWTITVVVLAAYSGSGGLALIAPLGPVVVVLLFFTVVGYAVRTWFRFEEMLHYRKRLLLLATATLPLIAVRDVYGILNVFSSVTSSFIGSGLYTNIVRFSMFADLRTYLVMDILMECVVVISYMIAGIMLPLDEDYRLTGEYPFPRLQHLGDTESQP